MVIRVALACGDEKYLERLVSGLEKIKNLDLAIFSDVESLSRGLSARHYDVF